MKVYQVKVTVQASENSAHFDYGTVFHDFVAPEGVDDEKIFRAIAAELRELSGEK